MIKWKVNILETLKEHGYTTYKLRREKIIGEGTIQKLRNDSNCDFTTLNKLCNILQCQPADLIEFTPDEETN